ncbi:MAG: glycoside hydrolase family 3 C-terminal domain-containing protein [Promicromonosporaceae bacterium]|nr:glycoside hydrolase family 3 C-terminal domain-containing protein [Promicromonosporaceae bacterium]
MAAPAVALATPAAAAGSPCPWVGSGASDLARAQQVVAQMTSAEKISMVHGTSGSAYTGYVPGVPRLCIPALTMQDGPVGVRMNGTTALPSASTLAATWDTKDAKQYGQVIGAEDHDKGVDVDLGPTVNIVRDPRWGRAFESYSEDPYLTGAIGTEDIKGIQSQGVMAQVKHWAVYNQETNRNAVSDDAVVSDRVVHEIYTKAFEAIVDDANPSSAMCSYSVINGVFACENSYLDNILKNQFGFQGFITSDWGGTHSTVASANAGMDMEMPGDSYFGASLAAAVSAGTVPQSRVDDMVTRILREEFRFGLVDDPLPQTPDAVVSNADHVATARQVSEDGTVLLKNDGVLPFSASSTHSIAVIGAGAGAQTMIAGGGSAAVSGTGTVTPLAGITARAQKDGIDVTYAQGPASGGALPAVDSSALTPASGTGHGLTAQFYSGTTLSGDPVATRVDPQVDFTWGDAPVAGLGATNWSARWTGTLTAPATGTYTFSTTSDDGSRLIVNGTTVVDNWGDHASQTKTGTIALTAGQSVPVEVDYYQAGGGANLTLGWTVPGVDLVQQAAQTAAAADVAVVYANDAESEGSDLGSIDLPGQQNALISAVAAANPHTVVVLNTGSAVTMPWLGSVQGVLEAWYPGQEAGDAIASLLFGDTNPSGKLPVTFPRSLADVPASTTAQWPGTGGTVQYSEGLDVGYRWYDDKGVAPLFPFGYGLSYTTFKVSDLKVSPVMAEGGKVIAQATVANTGSREGSDVVQVYLSQPAGSGEPPKGLVGFAKVDLKPGQSKNVNVQISARDASTWDSDAQQWTLTPGTYTVRAGDSSADLPAAATFAVTDTATPRWTTVEAPAVVLPGKPATVTTTFHNGSTTPAGRPTTALAAPDGWTVAPAGTATVASVAPGATASSTWTVTPAADATPGAATLTASTTYTGGGKVSGTGTVKIPYPSLGAAFDTVGVSDDSNESGGNLDGSGYSFSAQALASVGVTPGAAVPGGSGLVFPDVAAATPDAMTTTGQVVAASGSGTRLGVLAVGTNGEQKAPVTVTYTDGTTSTATIDVNDWYSNAAVAGSTLVATTPYWNRPPGSTYPRTQKVSLYATTVPLTAGKEVSYLTFGTNTHLHVFTIAVQ